LTQAGIGCAPTRQADASESDARRGPADDRAWLWAKAISAATSIGADQRDWKVAAKAIATFGLACRKRDRRSCGVPSEALGR
jgi:hypothetical protein